MQKFELQEAFEQLFDNWNFIKDHIKHTDPEFFERWKAGGFALTNEFFSMYPNLEDSMDYFIDQCEEEEDE